MSQRDLAFGDRSEKGVLPELNYFFKCQAIKTKGRYDEFDFIDSEKKIVFELKSRRIERTRYGSTMIGYNKIKEGIKLIANGWRVIFLFKFTDCLCFYRLYEDFDESCIMDGGRIEDNGYTKVRPHAFININSLSVISRNMSEADLLKCSKKVLIKYIAKTHIHIRPELREKIMAVIAE